MLFTTAIVLVSCSKNSDVYPKVADAFARFLDCPKQSGMLIGLLSLLRRKETEKHVLGRLSGSRSSRWLNRFI